MANTKLHYCIKVFGKWNRSLFSHFRLQKVRIAYLSISTAKVLNHFFHFMRWWIRRKTQMGKNRTNVYVQFTFHISMELTFFCWHICNGSERIRRPSMKWLATVNIGIKIQIFLIEADFALCNGRCKRSNRGEDDTKCRYQLTHLNGMILFTVFYRQQKIALYRYDTHVKCERGIRQLPLETWNWHEQNKTQ